MTAPPAPPRLIIASVGNSLLDPRNLPPDAGADSYGSRTRSLLAGRRAEECFANPCRDQRALEDELLGRVVAAPGPRELSAELATLLALPDRPGANDQIAFVVPGTIEAIVCARVLRRIVERRTGAAVELHLIASFQLDDSVLLERSGFPELIRVVSGLILAHCAAPGIRLPGLDLATVVAPDSAPVVLAITAGFRALSIYMTLTGLFFGAHIVYQPDRLSMSAFRLPSITIEPDTALWSTYRWLFDQVEREGSASREAVLRRLDGTWPISLEPYFFTDGDRVTFSALGWLLDARAKVVHLDRRTGLPRADFLEVLRPQLERGAAVGFIYFDVDRFKAINDGHGHAAGDCVLREVADRARVALTSRCEGAYLLRWGGEEFLGVVPDALEATLVRECAVSIHAAIRSKPISIIDRTIDVTATVGVAIWHADQGPLTMAVNAADRQMYLGKQTGRDRVMMEGP